MQRTVEWSSKARFLVACRSGNGSGTYHLRRCRPWLALAVAGVAVILLAQSLSASGPRTSSRELELWHKVRSVAEEEWGCEPSRLDTRLAVLRSEWSQSLETFKLPDLQAQLRCLVFLYVKGVLACESPATRKEQFGHVVGLDTGSQSHNRSSLTAVMWPLPRQRLQHTLLGSRRDTPLVTVPPTWHSFEALTRTAGLEAWGSPASSKVFFRDVVPDSLVVRAVELALTTDSKSSSTASCFLQAPSVLLHYLLHLRQNSSGLGAKSHATVDLTAYMQRNVSGHALWRFVYDDGGASSLHYLEVLGGLTPRSDLQTRDPWFLSSPAASHEVVRLLDQHGPALVRWVDTWSGISLR
jgi:hypothetical protein